MKIINNKNWNTHPSTNRSAPAQLQPICSVDTWNIKYGYIELNPPFMARMETYDTWVHLWMLKPRAVYAFFTPSFAFVALLRIVLEILVLGLHISGCTLAASSIFRRFIWPFVFLKWVCCTCGVTSWWKCFDCVACPQNNVPQASMKNVSQWNTWGVVLLWATSIQDVYGVSITQTQIPLLTFDFVGFGFFFIEFTSASISSKSSIFAFVSILIKRFFS